MASRAIGTRRSTINKRRKGALSVIVPWMKRFGVLLLVAILGIWIGAWLWMSGGFVKAGGYLNDRLVSTTAGLGFEVETVAVEGRRYSSASALKAIVDMQKGTPLFSFDPAALKEKIEKLEWVKRATVERRLPSGVYIRLQEHTPLALWQKDSAFRLLNEEGGVISTSGLGRFKDLMIVMGEEAPARAPALLADLNAESSIAPQITTAKWIDNRRWDLLTKSGVTIKLPEEDTGLALRILGKAEEEGHILSKDITSVDLREQGRIILRTRHGAMQDYKTGTNTEKAI